MSDEKTHLYQEADFMRFLATDYKGKLSGKPLSPKVISDNIGRLKRIQRVLELQIEFATSSEERFNHLKKTIKERDSDLRQTPSKNKYGYGGYIYAAHLYYLYLNQSPYNLRKSVRNQKT
mgnify:FL=1